MTVLRYNSEQHRTNIEELLNDGYHLRRTLLAAVAEADGVSYMLGIYPYMRKDPVLVNKIDINLLLIVSNTVDHKMCQFTDCIRDK